MAACFPNEGRFPTTHWSLVAQAGQIAGEARREALERLLRRYLPALRAHLLHTRRLAPEDADDVLQDFIASRIIEKDLLGRADRELGKFRTYLLTSLDRFLVDSLRRRKAKKRTPGDGGRVDVGNEEEWLPAPALGDAFDVAWARGVLTESLEQMRAECTGTGREDVWTVFDCRVLGPILQGTEPVDYEQLVVRFGFTSAAQASNVLMTGKRMFARIIRTVVGQYALGEEAIESEIRELHEVLAQQRP
jgi:DNA-directed RNA polymerase specialized sigma24 family protein